MEDTTENANSLVIRVRETLASCSTFAKDSYRLPELVSELVEFLASVYDSFAMDQEINVTTNDALEVLVEINQYLSSPSLDQDVIDALSCGLPTAVAKFAGLNNECLEIADSIFDCFVCSCSPRDMLTFFCEALDSYGDMLEVPGCFSPLLTGISKGSTRISERINRYVLSSFYADTTTGSALLSIPRRQFEHTKGALRIVIKVLMSISSKLDYDNMQSDSMFERAIGIADSIQTVCKKLEGTLNEKLQSLLGLYVLEIMAIVSISIGHDFSRCLPLVQRLSCFLKYCGISYSGSITGADVDEILTVVTEGCKENGDEYTNMFPSVKHGSCVAVIWGHISGEVARAAGEDISALKVDLRRSQLKRWQAVAMLKYIFSAGNMPWELKKRGIDFLLGIMEDLSQECNDECIDYSSYIPGLFAALQAVLLVMMYTADSVTRMNAFEAMKRVLADIPAFPRFDILKALIHNSNSTSLTAILFDRVRDELRMEKCQNGENNASQGAVFWNSDILELVEFILRPPKGGPPSFPEDGEAVQSALILYSFILMKESSDKTNFTGVLSKDKLRKVYNEWLLPLRTLVTGLMATSHGCHDQSAVDAVCDLNPVELVLYRCIELVEEKLKVSS